MMVADNSLSVSRVDAREQRQHCETGNVPKGNLTVSCPSIPRGAKERTRGL